MGALDSDARTIFDILIDAIGRGSEIIPLIGSGVSIDAGIPSAYPLIDYLVDFNIWIAESGWPSPRRYLEDHPWPSRHDLVMELMTVSGLTNADSSAPNWYASALDRLRTLRTSVRQRLVREAAQHELGGRLSTAGFILDQLDSEAEKCRKALRALGQTIEAVPLQFPSTTGYRSLLDLTCESDQTLIDSFFDRIMLGREPTLMHQYLAFLAKHLDLRVVLTTNFDSLIENAMADERATARVYEIVRDGPLPSARLVRRKEISVLKLHGGAYSLRTGADLDEHLDAATLREFEKYFTSQTNRPPVLLVMGYSGSDRRVMDIVEQHVRTRYANDARQPGNVDGTTQVRVIWIDRYSDSGPAKLKTIVGKDPLLAARVRVAHYRDCGRFIQDLYQRLTCQHAVTHKSYRPSRAHDRAIKPLLRDDSDPEDPQSLVGRTVACLASQNLTVLHADIAGQGTSTLLFQAGNIWERRESAIWLNVDASDYRSRATVLSVLVNEMCRYDRGLSKIHRPLLIMDVDYFACLNTPRPDSDIEADQHEFQTAVKLLQNALRRGKYLITIDSLGEFANSHPALPLAPDYAAVQFDRLIELIDAVSNKPGVIGESRLMVALTERPGHSLTQSSGERGAISVPCESPAQPPRDPITSMIQQGGRCVCDFRLLAVIAAVFMRKSRSRASLVTMIIRLVEFRPAFTGEAFQSAVSDFRYRLDRMKSSEMQADEAARIVAQEALDQVTKVPGRLDEWRVLEPLEGGFYWMHLIVRNSIFKAVRGDGRYVGKARTADVYHMLADFAYTDAFDRSQSMVSFIEYFFFRAMSIEHAEDDEVRLTRCKWLASTLRNDSNRLMGKPALVPLTNHIRTLIEMLVKFACDAADKSKAVEHDAYGDPNVRFHAARRAKEWRENLTRTVGIYADLLLNCGHPHTAMRYRLWQSDLILGVVSDGRVYAAMDEDHVLPTCLDVLPTLVTFADNRAEQKSTPRERQQILQLLIDVGVTASDAVLYERFPEKRQDWEGDDGETRRAYRFTIAKDALESAVSLSAALYAAEPSERNLEIKIRAATRLTEYKLRKLNSYRFMNVHPGIGQQVVPCPDADAQQVLAICTEALQDVRHGDKTSRRRRHRAYLYLSKARVQTLQHLWHAAEVTFNRARAALSRTGGSPERSALGVIGIFHAEMLLRRVAWATERLKGIDPSRAMLPKNIALVARLKTICSHSLRTADELLDESTDLLLNDSRTENRWRAYLKCLTARCLRLRADALAETGEPIAQVQARRTLLDRAMREVINGLTNTGMRSDRRELLNIELGRIFRALCALESSPFPERSRERHRDITWRLRVRYGIN